MSDQITESVRGGSVAIDERVRIASRKQQEGELGLKERWYPIQVKQKDKVGRPDIDFH